MTSPTVPVLYKGELGHIPQENLQAAIKAGGTIAVHFRDRDGNEGYIPHDQVPQAMRAGGLPASIKPPQVNMQPEKIGTLGNLALGVADTLPHVASGAERVAEFQANNKAIREGGSPSVPFGSFSQGVDAAAQLGTDWSARGVGQKIGTALQIELMRRGANALQQPGGRPMPAAENPAAAADAVTFAAGPAGKGKTPTIERAATVMPDLVKGAQEMQAAKVAPKSPLDVVQHTLDSYERQFQGVLDHQPAGGNVALGDMAFNGPAAKQRAINALDRQHPDLMKNPDIRQGIEDNIDHWLKGAQTNRDANSLRQTLNAEDSPFYNKNQLGQMTEANKGSVGKQANRALENAVRDELYDRLQPYAPPGTDIRALKQTQGNLMTLKQGMSDRMGSLQDLAAMERSEGFVGRLRMHGYVSPFGQAHAYVGGLANALMPEAASQLGKITGSASIFRTPRAGAGLPVGVAVGSLAAALKNRDAVKSGK